MRILVNDNASFEGAVSDGGSIVPQIHPHAAGLAIGWSGKIGVIKPGSVLSIQNDKVLPEAALVIIIDLEVSSSFGEAKFIEQVMISVGGVEELSN